MKILWLSRHSPQEYQVEALRQAFGDVEIVVKDLTVDSDPRVAVSQVKNLMSEVGAEEVMCVLPVAHLAEMTRAGMRPIRAVMERVPTGRVLDNGEREYEFKFVRFERVVKVDVVTEPL